MVGRGTSSKAMVSVCRCRKPFNCFWMSAFFFHSNTGTGSTFAYLTSLSPLISGSYMRTWESGSAVGSLKLHNCSSGSRSFACFVRDYTRSNFTSSALSFSEFFPVKEPTFFLKVTFFARALLVGASRLSSMACYPRTEEL